jgi:hypothetical protein
MLDLKKVSNMYLIALCDRAYVCDVVRTSSLYSSMLSYSPHVHFPTSSDVSIGNIVPTDTEETRIDVRKEKVREQLVT